MTNQIAVISSIVIAVLVSSCKLGDQQGKSIEFDSIDFSTSARVLNPLDTAGDGLPIFYNMYLSVELSSLFESAGAVFTPELMNSTDKTSEYLTSSQQAINLGIYAVDLSYARVFDQVETASLYFNAMKQLSQELGIPGDYFESTASRFERNFTDKDSLIALANEVYVTTEEYLKANERYTTAAQIILGGWVEAITIAIDVAIESRDPNIMERLIDQKYSLNNLMTMLSEHKSSEVIDEYLSELNKLKKQFDQIKVPFDVNFDADTAEGKEIIDKTVAEIRKLGQVVRAFRNKLVS
jgi:hypothetical protein